MTQILLHQITALRILAQIIRANLSNLRQKIVFADWKTIVVY